MTSEGIGKIKKAFGKIEGENDALLNAKGVGLGLFISNSLSKRLVKSKEFENFVKNGIEITSEYGKGSSFKFFVEDFENMYNIDIMESINLNGSTSAMRHNIYISKEKKFFANNSFKFSVSKTSRGDTNVLITY